MKHLKPFLEASGWESINVGELKDFANNSHFAYLIDEGFSLDVFSTINGSLFNYANALSDNSYFNLFSYIRIVKKNGDKLILFNWDDIKDYFIPFLSLVIRKYNLGNHAVNFGIERHGVPGVSSYSVKDVINDNIWSGTFSNLPIKYISIKKYN